MSNTQALFNFIQSHCKHPADEKGEHVLLEGVAWLIENSKAATALGLKNQEIDFLAEFQIQEVISFRLGQQFKQLAKLNLLGLVVSTNKPKLLALIFEKIPEAKSYLQKNREARAILFGATLIADATETLDYLVKENLVDDIGDQFALESIEVIKKRYHPLAFAADNNYVKLFEILLIHTEKVVHYISFVFPALGTNSDSRMINKKYPATEPGKMLHTLDYIHTALDSFASASYIHASTYINNACIIHAGFFCNWLRYQIEINWHPEFTKFAIKQLHVISLDPNIRQELTKLEKYLEKPMAEEKHIPVAGESKQPDAATENTGGAAAAPIAYTHQEGGAAMFQAADSDSPASKKPTSAAVPQVAFSQ